MVEYVGEGSVFDLVQLHPVQQWTAKNVGEALSDFKLVQKHQYSNELVKKWGRLQPKEIVQIDY